MNVNEPPSRRGNRGCWWAFVTVAFLLLVAILFPIEGGNGKEGAKHTQDLYQLKQVATALANYTANSDDCFPPEMSSGRGAFKYLRLYTDRDDIFTSDNTQSPEWLGNGSLGGRDARTVDEPDRTLMFFDSVPREIASGSKSRALLTTECSARLVVEGHFKSPLQTNVFFRNECNDVCSKLSRIVHA